MIRCSTAVCVLLLFFTNVFASRKDSTITTSDGVSLAISYFTPSTPMPAKGYPTILCVHGFGGSRDDYASIATLYNSFGYVVVTYTVRGQGIGAASGSQSGGLFNWFTGDRELKDVAEILGWMRTRKEIDSAHIGMEGISQGGLTTWGAAINRLPIKCAVPIIANPNYADNFISNGCINYNFTAILNYTKSFSKVNLGPYIKDTLLPALSADNYNYSRSLLLARDLKNLIPSINVPLFLQCAWYDQLFGSSYDFACFNNVKTPKKILMWSGNHGLPPTAEIENMRRTLTLRFYQRWLKEDTSETIMSKDGEALFFDPTNSSTLVLNDTSFKVNQLKPVIVSRFYLYPSAQLSESFPKDSMVRSINYIQNIGNESVSFDSDPFDSNFTMYRAGVHLSLTSTATLFQANPMLYDVDDTGKTVNITRGFFEERPNGPRPPTPLPREFELNPQYHTFIKGHRLRLVIKAGMPVSIPADEFGQSPYPPQESGTTSIYSTKSYPSYVILSPVIVLQPKIIDTNNAVKVVADQQRAIKPSIVVFQGEEIPVENTTGEIQLCNALGQNVIYQNVIDTRTLAPGVYFLREIMQKSVMIRKILLLPTR